MTATKLKAAAIFKLLIVCSPILAQDSGEETKGRPAPVDGHSENFIEKVLRNKVDQLEKEAQAKDLKIEALENRTKAGERINAIMEERERETERDLLLLGEVDWNIIFPGLGFYLVDDRPRAVVYSGLFMGALLNYWQTEVLFNRTTDSLRTNQRFDPFVEFYGERLKNQANANRLNALSVLGLVYAANLLETFLWQPSPETNGKPEVYFRQDGGIGLVFTLRFY